MEAIALMADIHANLPAAEAVIADIRRKHKPAASSLWAIRSTSAPRRATPCACSARRA